MSRLPREFARLYLPQASPTATPDLFDDQGRTRALVLEVVAPAAWEPLRRVWQGVQVELGLPPPAPAVSGEDGLQLWFSAPAPVPVAEARQFLAALCRRYLPELPAHRVRLWPAGPAAAAAAADARDAQRPRHVHPVPALQPDGERWSAFVAPDLVSLFVDTPWLDVAPGDEGQASLLAALASMPAHGWADRLAALEPALAAVPATSPVAAPAGGPVGGPAHPPRGAPAAAAGAAGVRPVGGRLDPRDFLQQVLDDEAAPLDLRVKAAKALLADRR